MQQSVGIALVLCIAFSGCGKKRVHPPTAARPGSTETGVASWYGHPYHGRRAANGEIYDMRGISAAHTTLPIPSYARVTNLRNGKSIVVRVNDRGPYVRGRVVDVSYSAANALGMVGKGVANVKLDVVQ